MTKDRTTARRAGNANAPISRPARIAAVTATTALLMATTGFGIVAVQEAITTGTVTSAEASTITPTAAVTPSVIAPAVAAAASLPDLSTAPALPSIKKILEAIPKTTTPNAPPAAAVPSTPTTQRASSDDAAHSEDNAGSDDSSHEGQESNDD